MDFINFSDGLANLEDMMALVIPIIIFMIPIVAILTAHQRKMTEILHTRKGNDQQAGTDIAALQHEMRELKQLMYQQAIAIDNLTHVRTSVPPAPASIQDRLTT